MDERDQEREKENKRIPSLLGTITLELCSSLSLVRAYAGATMSASAAMDVARWPSTRMALLCTHPNVVGPAGTVVTACVVLSGGAVERTTGMICVVRNILAARVVRTPSSSTCARTRVQPRVC